MIRRIAVAFVFLVACTQAAESVRVGVYENPPFVMRDGNDYDGMAVELWREVEKKLDLACSYNEYGSLKKLVEAAERGEVDVAVTNLAVTAERARLVKFTFPWFDSGLRILVKTGEKESLWQRLLYDGHAYAYAFLFLLFVGVALAVTVIRRWHDAAFPRSWLNGFTTSLKELISVAKSGQLPDNKPTWFRNILVSAWMIFGMAILAYVTSTITSTMTMITVQSQTGILELADLPGKNIAVLAGSGAESYLSQLGVHVQAYGSRQEAIGEVEERKMQAFVADAAVVEYWRAQHPHDGFMVIGKLFHPYKFAFAANLDKGDLADRISVALIELHESGKVAGLRAKYFGTAADSGSGGIPVPKL